VETLPPTPPDQPSGRLLRRALTKLHWALYASTWTTVLIFVILVINAVLLVINYPFGEGTLNPFDRGLHVGTIVTLVILILEATFFGAGARRAKALRHAVVAKGDAGNGTLADWVTFWHLNPFSRASDTDSPQTRVSLKTNLRIISAFMIVIEAAQLIGTLDVATKNSANLTEQPLALLATGYVLSLSAYGLFAFGSLWKTASRLKLTVDQQGEFEARQSSSLDHIGNFMVASTAYRLCLFLYTAALVLDL
jgi:hypothetical protein